MIAVWRYGSFNIGWSAHNLLGGLARVGFGFGAGVVLYRLRAGGRAPWFRIGFPLAAAVLAAILLSPALPREVQLVFPLLVFPWLVLGAANAEVGQSAPLCRWSGDLSYPLYIVHWPIYLWVGLAAGDNPALPILAILAALAGAQLALKLYDEPLRGWLSRRRRGERLPGLVPEDLGDGRCRVSGFRRISVRAAARKASADSTARRRSPPPGRTP